MGGGQTSPADLRPRRGKGVSGPRSTAGGERGPWIGPDMRKSMNRDMEINGEIVNDKVRYADLNLSPELMRAIDKKGYVQATPVQAGAIPYFMEWKDVIAKAPTGTGKTFAFGIPMVEHADPQGTQVTGLVLAPTRELAIQITDEIRDLAAFKPGVRTVCLYGGQPIGRQIDTLKKRSENVFELKAGTLYPLLHGLEEKQFVTSYEQEVLGKVRKYYQITGEGKKHLEQKKSEWKEYSKAVSNVLALEV